MAFQWALAGLGPVGVAAAVGITAVMLIAGASGAIDTSFNEVEYDDDGIFIPVDPFVPGGILLNGGIYLPWPGSWENGNSDNSNGNGNSNDSGNGNGNSTVNPDDNGNAEVTVDPDSNKNKDHEKVIYGLPYGFVNVYETQKANDWDPDIDVPDDTKPPASSFTVGAEAYDSNLGYIIAAIMAGLLTFWIISELSGRKKNELSH